MIYLQHLESGLMEVISPPSEFYPDLAGLRKTLGKKDLRMTKMTQYSTGDDMERVTWRSKQSLDFSFLMM